MGAEVEINGNNGSIPNPSPRRRRGPVPGQRHSGQFSGGADVSIGGYLSENVGFYTEPGISISEELTWNLEIGLVFQYGKEL